MTATNSEPQDRARAFLSMVGDKWPLVILCSLREGSRRFSELRRAVDGINQRLLSVTLRNLERDGLVTRVVRSNMPPHVRYELTPMGRALTETAALLIDWTVVRLADIAEARANFDAKWSSP
jgi:DNA-binding HxlR family transcriptional regulator